MRHNSQIHGALLGPRKGLRDRPGRGRPPHGRTGSFLGILGRRACGRERTGFAMNLLQGREATCPHCWETISLTLDLSVPEQSYIEDCPVCCKPMLISCSAVDGELAALSVDPSDCGAA